MLYFANLCNIIVVGLLPALFVFPTKCIGNVICPPNAGYLKERNSCVFFRESCSNFLKTKELCNDKNAYLIDSIPNSAHFDELCQFAQTKLPNESSFYLDAFKNKNRFDWGLNNSRKEEDEGNNCLEMIVSKSDCFLKDSPCHKLKWPLCDLPHANPCVYNKGGCEGICIPGTIGTRKCVCLHGRIPVGTKCYDRKNITEVGCYEPFTYDRNEKRCIWLMKERKLIYEHKETCQNHFSQYDQKAVSKTKPSLPTFKDLTSMDNYCSHIDLRIKYRKYFVGGTYNGHEQEFLWFGMKTIPLSRVCHWDLSFKSFPYNGYCVSIIKQNNGTCCITPIWCAHMKAYGICRAASVKFTRPDNTTTKVTCFWNNGGCLHECVMLFDGGRKCKCWQGFELVNGTECRYKDRCLENAGGAGCPTQTKLSFDLLKKCRIEIGNHNTNDTPIVDKSAFDFALFGVIVSCLIWSVCCLALFLFARRITPERNVTQSSITM